MEKTKAKTTKSSARKTLLVESAGLAATPIGSSIPEAKAAKKPARKPAKSKASAVSEDSGLTSRVGRIRSLVIVESPAKAKTLKKYLGRDYDVRASVGHIRDLPKSKIGVDVEHGFEPTYELIKGKQKVVEDLQKAALLADKIYLAADPDREGEAIAWHVANELKIPPSKAHRVLFNEITKTAVIEALAHPIKLNQRRFESQQARRILDRLVGYKISPILWVKVRRGLSAGRVQSVAVRLIVEREKEVKAFNPKAYWTILGTLSSAGKEFRALLAKIDGERVERTSIDEEAMALEIVNGTQNGTWKIASVNQKQRRRNPYAPFITSTMQQEAAKRCYFSAKKTMVLAQQLYEGVEIGEHGMQGLITYMRTDSTRLSDQSLTDAREFIGSKYGKEYLPEAPVQYKNKKNAQDAHEAVRPTSTQFTPDMVKGYLDADQWKLYNLIWKRYLASQMNPAVYDQTTIEFNVVAPNGKKYLYRSSGSVLRFDGFLAAWEEQEEKDEDGLGGRLPDLNEKSAFDCNKVDAEKHMTQPPPRFSESTLIKELEEKGIGRPSTYAAILSTIQDRKYVERKENRFHPTELGNVVTDLLIENFGNIVNVAFTANMEDQLDQIEEGSVDWVKALTTFYTPFEETLKVAAEKMRDVKREEIPTDIVCPKCEKPTVIKWGKNGRFVACQGYPECRFTSEFVTAEDGKITLVETPVTDEKCEKCSEPMMVKTGRFGRFLACSKYPECKTTKAITTGIVCPTCLEGQLAEKRTRFGKIFFSCNKYPNCKYAIWDKPIKGEACPTCKSPFLVEHYTKKEGLSIRCPNKECGFQKETGPTPEPTEVSD